MQTAAIQRRSERETRRPAARKVLLALCGLLVYGDISGFADPPSANKSAAQTQPQRQYPALATFTARYLNNHALLDAKLGRFALADRQFQEALTILKDLGEQDPVTAIYLNNLAELYRSMGQYAKAEPLLREALVSSQRLLVETFGRNVFSGSRVADLAPSMRLGRLTDACASRARCPGRGCLRLHATAPADFTHRRLS